MFFYCAVFFICLLFSFISEYSDNKSLKYISNLYIFLVILFVSAFRVNVGTDYVGHYFLYEYIQNGEFSIEYKEPLFLLLCLIAQQTYLGFFFVIVMMTFITFYPIYYISKKEKSSLIQIVYFLSFYLLSQCLIRQFVSISLGVLGSYFFLKKGNEKIGLLWCVIGALFHMSFWCYVIILFFSKYIKLNKLITMLLILASFVIVVKINIFEKLGNVFSFIEYGRYLSSYSKHNASTKLGSGLGILLRYVQYIIIYCLTIKYVKPKLIFNINLLFLVLCLFDFSSLVLNILIRLRFVFSPLYMLPFFFVSMPKKKNSILVLQNYFVYFLIVSLFMFFIQKDSWGNVPYQSLLFTEMKYY